jgi:hypothetical protein
MPDMFKFRPPEGRTAARERQTGVRVWRGTAGELLEILK